MDNIGDKILRKIKEEKICPKPRWRFLLEDCFIWFFFLVSLLIGAASFCMIIYVFSNNDWDIYRYLHTSFVGYILISIPYVWFLVLLVFLWIAYYNFKCTKSGYRHETFFIVVLSVIGSILLGAFLHTLGAGGKIENAVAASVPFYEKLACCGARKDIWNQPAIGLLGGEIVNILDNESFDLEDFNGMLWVVQEDDDTLEYEPLVITAGEQVKIIGEKRDENIFWAREIRPWKNKGEIRSAKTRIEKNIK